MNFQTHHNTEIDINGTSLQGHFTANYYILDAVFGEPLPGDGYKVDAEWHLRYEDGTVATIYNWKSGRNYLGADGLDVHQISEWNIGGTSQRTADLVKQTLNEAIK